jgi:peptide/nickel transport system substrate-binding protein
MQAGGQMKFEDGRPRISTSLTRRQLLQSAAVSGAVLGMGPLLAACGGSGNKQKSGGPAIDKKTLVVAAPDVPSTVDPDFDVQDQTAVANAHATLVEYKWVTSGNGYSTITSNYDVQPLLADSWSVSPDGKKYHFTLKPGVVSAFGNELTTDDIVYSWERRFAVKNMGLVNSNLWGFTDIKQLQVLDKYNFEINLPAPVPFVLQDLAIGHLSIFDSKQMKSQANAGDPWSTNWAAKNGSGFGPYVVERLEQGQQMVLTANPRWVGAKPTIGKVIYRAVPDGATRLQSLLQGDVDLALSLSPQQVENVRKSGAHQTLDIPANIFLTLYMNNSLKPTDDPRVRQALSYAVPYQDILNTVYFGKAEQSRSPLSKLSADYDGSAWNYETNLDKARSLLSQAGLASGFSSTVYVDLLAQDTIDAAVLIQQSFRQIGVNLQVQKVPEAAYGAGKNAQKWPFLVERNYSIVDTGAFTLPLFWGKGSILNWGVWGGGGTGGYNWQQEVQNALHSTDQAMQRQAWKKAQQVIVEEAGAAFLALPGFHLTSKSSLKDFVYHPDNHLRFRHLTWA